MIEFSVIDALIGYNFRARRLTTDGPWQYFYAQERLPSDPLQLVCRQYDEFGHFTEFCPLVREEELHEFEIVILD